MKLFDPSATLGLSCLLNILFSNIFKSLSETIYIKAVKHKLGGRVFLTIILIEIYVFYICMESFNFVSYARLVEQRYIILLTYVLRGL